MNRTESRFPGLENNDIREQADELVSESPMKFRGQSGNTATSLAEVRFHTW